MTEEEKEEEEEEEKVAVNTMKHKGEEEEVAVTTTKQVEDEEVMEESEVKNEPPREEHNPPEAMIEPPRETKQPTEPLTFSSTSDLLASQFKPGQHVLVGGAERGLVKFVGHTHFKEGLWIGVELEREKGKNNGSIDGKIYFNCSPGYGVFAPVRKVAILNEDEEEEEEVALPLSATSSVAEMMTKEEKEEEEEVAVTTMKHVEEEEGMEEAESKGKNEPPREEHNPPEAMIEPPRETKQPTEPLTFSSTSDLLASQFKPGQHVLVGGAERGLVKFVGHTHFKEGLWIGVELEREKGKNNGSIDGKIYFNCSPGYGVFAPVRKVAILNEDEEEEEEVALTLSATSSVAEMMTKEEKEEEEEVAVTTMKHVEEEEEMEEAESKGKNEPPREEHNPPEAMIEPPRETKQPTEPLTFSTTSDLLASQFKPGQHVLVGGAERGLVKFVGHTHFKEGLWIGVELEREKGKNNGSIDGKIYFNCSPGYGVFAPVRKVAILNEEEEEEEEVALPLSATFSVAEVMTEEEKEEEEEVAVTTMKHVEEEKEMEEAESKGKNEPPREELNPPEAMIDPPRETKQPTEPLTFSSTSDLLASQFKPGQHVLVGGAERGLVKFVGHTHFKEGLWIGVELEREKGKNNGSIDGKIYFNCSPGYGVFAPVRKVTILNEEEEEEEEVALLLSSTSSVAEMMTEEEKEEEEEVAATRPVASIVLDSIKAPKLKKT